MDGYCENTTCLDKDFLFGTDKTFTADTDRVLRCCLHGNLNSIKDLASGVDVNLNSIKDLASGVDVFFLLWAGATVFLMQAGFAMLCAGSVRNKNVKNIMLKNLLDACGGAIGFWAIGYGFAYGGADLSEIRFIGYKNFFMNDMTEANDLIGWFFQFAFAATAATIVAGTVAERCKMQAYICYSLFLTGFVYPVVVHAIWGSSGFLHAFNDDPLFGVGMVDFAGSGVVHMTGGFTALIAAIILGPRKGRFYDADGNVLDEPVSFPPHSVALQVLGTFILWFGWYGFNPGSALMISTGATAQTAALCAVTTTLAGAAGAVSALFTDSIIGRFQTGETEYDLTMCMNGCLGGLVGVTASCSVIEPWAAVIIGLIAGWVYIAASKALVMLKIDDAVDAIPVHFANGLWGVIAAGLFASPEKLAIAYTTALEGSPGLFYGGGKMLGANIVGIAFILAWVSVMMTPFFYVLKIAGMFRVDPLEEDVGLDISHHKGAAYNLDGPKAEDVEELMIRRSQHGKPSGGVSAPTAQGEP